MSTQQLAEIQRSLGRIEGKLESIEESLSDGEEVMDSHDNRIRNLERRQWWRDGVAAAVGAFFGIGGAHLPK